MATLPSTDAPRRIVTLDILRGVAVMGILAMNIVAFAMPIQAYFSPDALGPAQPLDRIVYALNFIFVDGKMRGSFSFLFGASMLLIIGRAEANGQSPAAVTYRRQAWLLLFGAIHFYLIWFGDILFAYALTGMVAFLFRNLPVRSLLVWGAILLVLQTLIMAGSAQQAHSLAEAMAGPNPTADAVREWKDFAGEFDVVSPEKLREIVALHLGPWTGLVREQFTEHLTDPVFFALLFGPETLAYMLFGMAGLKSGFLTGDWPKEAYRKVALACLAVGIPVYAFICWMLYSDGFTVPGIFTWYMTATVPFRPLMVVAYAALIILATRSAGWLVERIAAAGRAAFSNYLGTSIIMTAAFYGWGLGFYGSLGRAGLWLVVIAMWVLMLAWSKPWLERLAYGPFEWLWRSLARWELQPMRKRPRMPATAA
jgi:uncharacterized protein